MRLVLLTIVATTCLCISSDAKTIKKSTGPVLLRLRIDLRDAKAANDQAKKETTKYKAEVDELTTNYNGALDRLSAKEKECDEQRARANKNAATILKYRLAFYGTIGIIVLAFAAKFYLKTLI